MRIEFANPTKIQSLQVPVLPYRMVRIAVIDLWR